MEDYDSKQPKFIVKSFSSDFFKLDIIDEILKISEEIQNTFFPEKEYITTCISLIKGSSLHILKINDKLL